MYIKYELIVRSDSSDKDSVRNDLVSSIDNLQQCYGIVLIKLTEIKGQRMIEIDVEPTKENE